MLLTDYLLHWVDITRGWLADGGAGRGAPGARRRLARAGPTGRGAQPLVRDAVDGHRLGGHGDPADHRQQRRLASRAARSGCTAPRAPCAAACSSTPTGSSSTTARPARPGAVRRVVRRRLRRDHGRADVCRGRGPRPENSAADAARSVAVVLAARESAERRRHAGRGLDVRRWSTRCRSTSPPRGSTPRAGRAGARRPGTRAGATGLTPDEEWQHLMRFRPGTPVAEDGVAGRGAARRRPRRRCAGTALRHHGPDRQSPR